MKLNQSELWDIRRCLLILRANTESELIDIGRYLKKIDLKKDLIRLEEIDKELRKITDPIGATKELEVEAITRNHKLYDINKYLKKQKLHFKDKVNFYTRMKNTYEKSLDLNKNKQAVEMEIAIQKQYIESYEEEIKSIQAIIEKLEIETEKVIEEVEINTHEKLLSIYLKDDLLGLLKELGYEGDGTKEEMVTVLLNAIENTSAYTESSIKVNTDRSLTEEEYYKMLVDEMNKAL